MKHCIAILALVCAACSAPTPSEKPAATTTDAKDVAAWEAQAQNVTIIRDDWGIPHVYGKSDADAVFGVVYAQAEDDFNRVETNYLNSLGRLAEAEGESEVFRDLRMKLFMDPADLKAKYDASPDWLKALMNAYANGLNYYLHKHPDVKPRVITHFEPWMALSFTEGSIGGDIERISLPQLEALYGKSFTQTSVQDPGPPAEPTGSNGFAIAPSNSASGKALLWINPHTSFFFRAEAQMVSEEGLNAYGAITWGQFFIYQGFNEHAGWMHTSSGVDNIDEYFESIVKKPDGKVFYKYGAEERPVTSTVIKVPYKTANGMAERPFTVFRTHHGPVVREADGYWMSVKLMQEPIKALTQSYTRTKAKNYKAFKETMDLHTNSSNNTVFADSEGNIAYFHANFIPKRDTKFDWSKPVDGSSAETEWGEVMSVDESPNVLNPPNGWIQNTNNWPFSAAGANSPKQKAYPTYVDNNGENPRGVHAIRVLDKKGFTMDSLRAAAFDSYLPEFAILVPRLLKTYGETKSNNPFKAKVAPQIAALRGWDYRWSADSVPTTLAVFWGEELWQRSTAPARKANLSTYEYMETKATPQEMLGSLEAVVEKLTKDFGTWKTAWGEVNRFQRLTDDIVHPFDDNGPSIPVPFTSSRWGSLASFGARSYKESKKIYGTSGNSFVAVVEFGDRVKARAVTAGGQSGDPSSKHFNDQAKRYATGDLREVYFYRDQLKGHTEREYRPGQ